MSRFNRGPLSHLRAQKLRAPRPGSFHLADLGAFTDPTYDARLGAFTTHDAYPAGARRAGCRPAGTTAARAAAGTGSSAGSARTRAAPRRWAPPGPKVTMSLLSGW